MNVDVIIPPNFKNIYKVINLSPCKIKFYKFVLVKKVNYPDLSMLS